MDKIMILEDNVQIASYYKNILSENGYVVKMTHNDEDFFRIYADFKPDVIILDIKLVNSELNGLEIFKKLKDAHKLVSKVIVSSGEATRTEIAQAMKLGAYTFMEKRGNFDLSKFLSDVQQAINLKKQEEKNISLRSDYEAMRLKLIETMPLIGISPAILSVKEKIRKFAEADIDVLIEGETGTGKEVVANNIYWQSKRVGKAFIKVNAGGLPDTLIDSQLYGHKKGSFTGAIRDRKGYFEQASDGILFLDEIANLSLAAQAKILRTIENREISIIGGKTKLVDVKMIFACNRNLREMVAEKTFRDDLYYRLEGNTIVIPPLRERGEDILLFIDHFLRTFSLKYSMDIDINISNLYDIFSLYDWPGNIRELEKFCESVFILNDHINNKVLIKEFEKKRYGDKNKSNSIEISLDDSDYQEIMENFEKRYLEYQLQKHQMKVTHLAQAMKLDKSTIYKKFKKLGIVYK